MAEKAKSELANILPEFVDSSGRFVLPTSGEIAPESESSESDIKDYVPAAAALGAGAVYAGSKAFPAVPQSVADERKIAGTQSRLDLIDRMITGRQGEVSQARAPYLAEKSSLTTAAEAARMEAQRNQMLMEAVMKRAVEAGIDPRQFLESPETFVRSMSPEKGYGTKNWIRQEVPNINPLVERGVNTKGELIPAVKAHEATAPRAQQVVGSTVMQPSGVYTPERFGSESARTGSTLSNVEQSLLRAMQEKQRAENALAALSEPGAIPAERDIAALERKRIDAQLKLEEQMAQAAKSKSLQPGVLERLGMMVSGPKMTAGLGALGGIELTQAYENYQKGEYDKALLNAMSGVGGAAMMSPFFPAKAAGALMVGIPAAYEYGPKAFDLAKRGYESIFMPSKRSP
jgi:hypothetical protein